MTFTGAAVLFAVIWFLVLFLVLPQRIRTQAETGRIARGTPASAPDDPMIRGKMLITTAIALVLWAALVAIILWGGFSIRDFDPWGRI